MYSTYADILCSDTLCNRSIQTHADTCIHSCPDARARTDFALTPHVLNKYHNTDMSPYSHTIKTGLTYNSLILILNPPRFSWYADLNSVQLTSQIPIKNLRCCHSAGIISSPAHCPGLMSDMDNTDPLCWTDYKCKHVLSDSGHGLAASLTDLITSSVQVV